VVDDDLPTFFAHQLDPEGARLAAFQSRGEAAFATHWARIRRDTHALIKTILLEGEVAGNIVSFDTNGRREVGYWIGREFWGRGVATAALEQFLVHEIERPLFAHVAEHNHGSIRVLEKCGFVTHARNVAPLYEGTDDIEEVVLKLG
jgi:RimJ/RimL family protein N-acetyltransferase